MVAALGETTGAGQLERLRNKMLASSSGRRILRTRPTLSTETIDLNYLRSLSPATFGNKYVSWLDAAGVSPDTRTAVHYVDDPELAYVMRRYRETHDFFHTLTDLPVTVPAEVALKWFEWVQTGLPMTGLSAVFGPLRLNSQERQLLRQSLIPWAVQCGSTCQDLMCVEWEKMWEWELSRVREELGIWPAPNNFEESSRVEA
ncbi:hypothetical protein BZG36_04572 [Bifiguratus adelaidae]|uniref:4-hydroxy-3-methoxy-5-polyprenylbenzoate decarboxylase n=1 Tax=Bifiguratus adelaidae TaxID=1938954 RepID=A0A261XUR6_9FUNG|nr:hypothetical protein BZG36_04572 [Bifiguratus adelaidae]